MPVAIPERWYLKRELKNHAIFPSAAATIGRAVDCLAFSDRHAGVRPCSVCTVCEAVDCLITPLAVRASFHLEDGSQAVGAAKSATIRGCAEQRTIMQSHTHGPLPVAGVAEQVKRCFRPGAIGIWGDLVHRAEARVHLPASRGAEEISRSIQTNRTVRCA